MEKPLSLPLPLPLPLTLTLTRWVVLGFTVPLLFGGSTSVALEMAALSIPPFLGSGLGLGLSFAVLLAPLQPYAEP